MSLATIETTTDQLAVFHRTLAELCRAGVPLPRAFRVLLADLEKGPLRAAVADLASDVECGVPFDQAYARHQSEFPPLYRALVQAGIACGDLPGVLEEISRHAALRAQVAARLRRALAYPLLTAIFVLVLGGGVAIFFSPAHWTLAESTTMASPTPVVLGALGILAALTVLTLFFAWVQSPLDAGRGLGFRIPLVGPLRNHAAKASFASTMALLTRRQVPLPAALTLAAEATEDTRVRRAIVRMSEAAHEGQPLAESVRAGSLLEPSMLWLIETAERGGSAHVALDDVARIHRQRLERASERLAVLVTPCAELVLGIIVFLCAWAFMVPLMRYAGDLFTLQ